MISLFLKKIFYMKIAILRTYLFKSLPTCILGLDHRRMESSPFPPYRQDAILLHTHLMSTAQENSVIEVTEQKINQCTIAIIQIYGSFRPEMKYLYFYLYL